MSKACIFLADGFEEIEGLTVVDILRRAGVEIHMVSITGETKVTGSHGIEIKCDTCIGQENFSETELFVLPGGMPGTKNLGACKALTELLAASFEAGKKLAAICAAPSVLGDLGILKGKKACCYPGFEEHLTGAGGIGSGGSGRKCDYQPWHGNCNPVCIVTGEPDGVRRKSTGAGAEHYF